MLNRKRNPNTTKIIELHREGKTLSEISKVVGVTKQRVWQILKAQRIPPNKKRQQQ